MSGPGRLNRALIPLEPGFFMFPRRKSIAAKRTMTTDTSKIDPLLVSGTAGRPAGIWGDIRGNSSVNFGLGFTNGMALAAKSTACSTGLYKKRRRELSLSVKFSNNRSEE